MNYHVLTLFPEMIESAFLTSITGRAVDKGLLTLDTVNIRDYAEEKRKGRIDDYSYGGGAGMIMQAEPVYQACQAVMEKIRLRDKAEESAGKDDSPEGGDQLPEGGYLLPEGGDQLPEGGYLLPEGGDQLPEGEDQLPEGEDLLPEGEDLLPERDDLLSEEERQGQDSRVRVIYMSPAGRTFDQKIARELAAEKDLIFLCGHYEGIDQRVLDEIVTDEISIGDFVLTGGELPALVCMDTIARLVEGVLSNEDSAADESFMGDGLLEYPQYSRPEEWHGRKVPGILLSGDHQAVDRWRREQSLIRTAERRPDLCGGAVLDKKDRKFVVKEGLQDHYPLQ